MFSGRRNGTHLGIVTPILVAFGSVARVQDHVAARVVQARLVPSDLANLAEHPILRGTAGKTNARISNAFRFTW